MKNLFLFTAVIAVTGCQNCDISGVGVSEGDCILEVSKAYVSGFAPKNIIYKVEEISHREKAIAVTKFHNNGKYYLGKKSHSYFAENRHFKYETITCPGEKKKAGIAEKIRKVRI